MGDLSVSDWLLLAFFMLSGFYTAFRIGGKLTNLAIVWLFCRNAKLEDLAWKMFTISEMRYGILKGQMTYTITGKNFTVRIMRKQPEPEPPAASPKPAPAP